MPYEAALSEVPWPTRRTTLGARACERRRDRLQLALLVEQAQQRVRLLADLAQHHLAGGHQPGILSPVSGWKTWTSSVRGRRCTRASRAGDCRVSQRATSLTSSPATSATQKMYASAPSSSIDLDARGDALARELERLGSQPEHDPVPARAGARRPAAGRSRRRTEPSRSRRREARTGSSRATR